MRRLYWIALGGVLVVASVVVIFVGSAYLRIEPLPNREQLLAAERQARQHHDAERQRDLPSYENLPAIAPMKIDNALILEEIDGRSPGIWQVGNALKPAKLRESTSDFLPRMDFRVEYVIAEVPMSWQQCELYCSKANRNPCSCNISHAANEMPVIVEVTQYPNDAWPRYYAKWSPNPSILQKGDPDLDITRVTQFKNRVVMNRQYHLWFYWPSGRNLVSVMYTSKIVQEEFLSVSGEVSEFFVGAGTRVCCHSPMPTNQYIIRVITIINSSTKARLWWNSSTMKR